MSEWLPRALAKVARLARYEDDWDSYGGLAPNAMSICAARFGLAALETKPRKIIAIPEGGIEILLQSGACVEFCNDGDILSWDTNLKLFSMCDDNE